MRLLQLARCDWSFSLRRMLLVLLDVYNIIDDVFASGEHTEDSEGGDNVEPHLDIQKIHREYDADK